MSLKDGNGNVYKIYKGRAKPLNVFINGEQIAGYTEETLRGETINFENTYEDEFSNIKICGGFIQEGVTEPKAESITFVEPTFASNYEVTFKEGTIEIPRVITLDDGTEVDAELKGIRNIEGETTYCDYIEVVDGSVKLYKVIRKVDVTNWTFVFFSNKNSTSAFSVYRNTQDAVSNNIAANAALCNAFLVNGMNEVQYNSALIPYGVCVVSTRIYLSIKCDDVGVTTSDTAATKLAAFHNWLKQMSEAGTPVTIWYAHKTPIVTDITNSDIGRALLNLNPKTYYKNTSISITAEGATPSVSATAKVNKEEENENI